MGEIEREQKFSKEQKEEIFFKFYGKENFERHYKMNEEKAESNKENAIKKIDNLRKKLIREMEVVINESNKEVFALICQAYFNEEIVVKNEKTEKEISLKTVLDEVTKDKVKQDNIDEFYIEALWENYVYMKKELGLENNYKKLVEKIDSIWHNFEYIRKLVDDGSKYFFKEFSDDGKLMDIQERLDVLKKLFQKEMNRFKSNFKEIKKDDLLERMAIFVLVEHYKRNIQRNIKELEHEHNYTTEEKARYKIPIKDKFTLIDIAEIYCEFLGNKSRQMVDKKYDMLRRIASDLAISELHKESKLYLIPQSRVINYLAELEVREMNDKKTISKAITKKDIENLKNEKETNFNLFNFQRLATSIYAREINKVKINNMIRQFQIEVFTDFINVIKIENIF